MSKYIKIFYPSGHNAFNILIAVENYYPNLMNLPMGETLEQETRFLCADSDCAFEDREREKECVREGERKKEERERDIGGWRSSNFDLERAMISLKVEIERGLM